MVDVKGQFFGTQRRQRDFQRCDIEGRLAAEMLIDHPRICPRLLNNAADASTGEAMSREFRGGCAQDFLAALLGGTAGTTARRRLTLACGGFGCGVSIS